MNLLNLKEISLCDENNDDHRLYDVYQWFLTNLKPKPVQ